MNDSTRPRSTPTSNVDGPASARVVGRFQCEARLASEGMLETWRARVQGLSGFDRVFVIKCLAPGALVRRPSAAENLLRAARAATGLRDARLATVTDSGLAPGSAYVATEYVHGVSLQSLKEFLGGTQPGDTMSSLDWPAALAYVGGEIARALAAVHARPGLVHGGLSLGNVMVTAQGAVKVLDVGLRAALHTPAEMAVNQSRRRLLAPELVSGGAPTPASDVYAAGALLLELGDTRRGDDRAAARPMARLASLPDGLALAVGAMLELEAGERPAAERAIELFKEALAGRSELAVRAELGALVRRVLQAHPQGTTPPPEMVETAAAAPAQALEEEEGEPPSNDFGTDEPTKILAVSDDGKPELLAALLKDLRGEAKPSFPTPATGTPIPAEAHARPTPARGIAIPADAKSTEERQAIANPGGVGTATVAKYGGLGNSSAAKPGGPGTAAGAKPGGLGTAPLAKPGGLGTAALAKSGGVGAPTSNVVNAGAPVKPGPPGGRLPAIPRVPVGPGAGPLAGAPAERPPLQPTLEIQAITDPVAAPAPAMQPAPVAPLPAATAESEAVPEEMPALTSAEVSAAIQTPEAGPLQTGPAVSVFSGTTDDGGVVEQTESTRFEDFSQEIETAATSVDGIAGRTREVSAPDHPTPSLTPLEIEPLPRPRGRVAAVLVGVLLVSGAVGAFVYVRADRAATTAALGADSPPPLAAAPAPAPTPEPAPAPEPAPVAPLPPVVEDGPPPPQIEVTSEPKGATIWLGGKDRGVTPKKLKVPGEVRELRLVKPGYHARTVKLGPSTGTTLTEKLEPTTAPLWGEAIVKVECRTKGKLPVVVNGKETGLLCPTGKLGLQPGTHEIAILDPATGESHAQTIDLVAGGTKPKRVWFPQ